MSSDSTTILFGLPGVRVQRVERVAGEGRVVHLLTDDPSAAACPACGVFSTRVRQRRITGPRDLPYGDEPLALRWHKVQYACVESGCGRKAFTEQIAEVPARARLTGRLRRHVASRVAGGLSISGAAGRLVSWPIAHAAFVARAESALADPPPVGVLGIDETRRGRPVWRRGEDGKWRLTERFETNFVDLADGYGLLGQTAGRTTKTVTDWLDARGQAWKDQVRIVAMDPCASYRSAIATALPHATIVADHFHLVRLANQAVTDVRRRVTWDTHGRRGRATDPAWAARRRLQRGRERLSPTGELRALLATARTGGQRNDIAHRLHRFYDWCARADVPELTRLATTIDAWWPQVLGFLTTGVTNAATEATNRTVKTVARTAYGFRNLTNQRRRVRFACTRHHRRVSTAA